MDIVSDKPISARVREKIMNSTKEGVEGSRKYRDVWCERCEMYHRYYIGLEPKQ